MWSNNSKLSFWSLYKFYFTELKRESLALFRIQGRRTSAVGFLGPSFFLLLPGNSLDWYQRKVIENIVEREDREWMRVCSLNWIFSQLLWSGPGPLLSLYGSLRLISLWNECMQVKFKVYGELLYHCCFTAQWRMSDIILRISLPHHIL